MVIGLEQTGRLHEPVKLFLQRRWVVKLIHPLATSHLRQGSSQNTKTEAMDLDALMRAVTGCYGLSPAAVPVASQRWRAVRRPATAKLDAEFVLDLAKHLGPAENAAAYAVVWVLAPKAIEAQLSFGSADGAVVWVNGKREYAWLKGRRDYRSRTDPVPIRLKKGANEILIKVTLTAKEWKFGAHLTNAEGRPIEGLRTSLTRRP